MAMKAPDSLSKSLNDVKYEQYVNNLHDRLPQLIDPSDIDCQRWPWELVQNAKDTVVKRSNPSERFVDITIRYYTDPDGGRRLCFEHNGDQFTIKAITGLIWKFSAEKRNEQTTEDGLTRDKQSTGRFGTGFMTTHALSLTVDVSGSIFHDDPDIMRDVSVDFTLHREGPDDESYKNGVNLTERELYENMGNRHINGELPLTRFTYHLNKESSDKAANIGIDNVKANAAQTMLFCPSVRSISVIDDVHNTTFKITRQSLNEEKNIIKETVFKEERNDENHPRIRRFISTEIEEYSEPISNHWKVSGRKLRLHIAVEVDATNNVIPIPQTSPSVYCSLPLIGFERMSLPFYINSNDFEPATERTSLYLKKKRFEYRSNEDTGEDEKFYLQSGINWYILERSLPLYESIVDYLIENGYGHRYNLINGLNQILKGSWDNETKNCLAARFVLPLRNLLINKNLVKTKEGYRSIKSEVRFVECDKDYDLHALYEISKAMYGNNLAIEDENIKWVSLKWGRFQFDHDFEERKSDNENPTFPTIQFKQIAEFIEAAENLENLELNLNTDESTTLIVVEGNDNPSHSLKLLWLNKFYEWIETSKITTLSERKIVPNRIGVFCSIESGCDLRDASDISTGIFEFMKKIELDWDTKLLMEGVQHVKLPKETTDNVITAIKERSNEIRTSNESTDTKLLKLLPILLAVPLSEDGRTEEFLQKRLKIISILKVMFASKCEGVESISLCLKAEVWNDTDKWFMDIVSHVLAERKHIDIVEDNENVEDKKLKYCTPGWLSDTLDFMFQKSYLHQEDIASKDDKSDTLALIPNMYGEFCPINDLHTQGQVPDELLNDVLIKTGYDIKKELLFKGFTLNNKITITEMSTPSIASKYSSFFESDIDGSEIRENKNAVANYLIHLVPGCGDSFRKIREIYDKYMHNYCAPIKISTSDLNIWKGTTSYLISFLADSASKCGSLKNIGLHLSNKPELSTLTEDLQEDYKSLGISWLNELAQIVKDSSLTLDENLRLLPDWYGELHPISRDRVSYNGLILRNYKGIQSLIEIMGGDLWKHFKVKNIDDEDFITSVVNPDYVFVTNFQNNTDNQLFSIVDRLIDYCSENNDTSWRATLKSAIGTLLNFFDENSSSTTGNDEPEWARFFPKTYGKRKEFSYDYIWDAETKARIAKINDNFTPDEIDQLIRERETIQEIMSKKDYYISLETENARLRKIIADLQCGRVVEFGGEDPGLSQQDQYAAQLEAQKKMIEMYSDKYLFPENYGVCDEKGKPYKDSAVEVIDKMTEDIIYIVVKSYRDRAKPFIFNPNELDYILKQNAILYIYTRNKGVLGIEEVRKPKENLMHQSKISISFNSVNLDAEEHIDRLLLFSDTLHWFSSLHFNFDNFNISNETKEEQDIHSHHIGKQNDTTDSDL